MKKYLVITVGTGIGTNEDATKSIANGIVKSIEASHPDDIIFVVTKESKTKTIPEIKALLPELPYYKLIYIDDANDINEVFAKISEKIRYLKEVGHNVVVDFTSGTKAMSAGAVLAAAVENTMVSYVAGERVGGKVVRGGERVLTYTPAKGIISIQEKIVEKLFDHYQFDAAIEILDDLLSMTAVPDTVKRLEKTKKVIKGYSAWDKFDHKRAFELFSGIDEIPPENKEFLGKLRVAEKEPFFIADLLNSADRRSVEGKYDDAVARLYRVVELIAQYILKKKYGIDPSNVELDKIPLSCRSKYERKKDEKGKIKLGLSEDYELLTDLEDEHGKKFGGDKRLRDLLNKRNESVLAHGLTVVSREIYDKLYSRVYDFAKMVVKNIEELMEKSKFRKFKDIKKQR